MSDSSESHRAIEKRVKQSQDVGGSSSEAKKPHAHKIILRPPPPVPLDEKEEEEPLRIHSPIEHPSGQRTPVNYMKEDSKTIINHWNTACYDSHKAGPDPRFWSYFHADWYRSVYKRKQTPVVPMQWTNWAFMEKNKDCQAFKDIIEMCKYHGLKNIMAFLYD
jgi:hypothetical protein